MGFILFFQLILGHIFCTIVAPDALVYPDTWWGTGDPAKEDTAIKPFKIEVTRKVLDDLKHRLDNIFPFQPPLEGAKQHYGMNTNLLKTVVKYWTNNYNWNKRQQFLNKYPQYTTSIQGLRIHYLHVKPKAGNSSNVKILPLLLLHGWPGSVREFYEIIPFLTERQPGRKFVFEVIIPSLPGFGFSEATNKPGMSPARMAQIFKNLMARLGFDKFFVQGGDLGAVTLSLMSVLYPGNLLGAHSNMCYCVSTPCILKTLLIGQFFPSRIATTEELPLFTPVLGKMLNSFLVEMGYLHIQATKPDTIGVALRDSPVGLAAYFLEKFTTWTNPQWKDLEDGGLTRMFTMDQLLDNIMIYWVTRSITTSQRLYAETFNSTFFAERLQEIPSEVPTACARFKYDIVFQPESILRLNWLNLKQVTLYQDGGHFAAFELPEVLANDIYNFTEKVI